MTGMNAQVAPFREETVGRGDDRLQAHVMHALQHTCTSSSSSSSASAAASRLSNWVASASSSSAATGLPLSSSSSSTNPADEVCSVAAECALRDPLTGRLSLLNTCRREGGKGHLREHHRLQNRCRHCQRVSRGSPMSSAARQVVCASSCVPAVMVLFSQAMLQRLIAEVHSQMSSCKYHLKTRMVITLSVACLHEGPTTGVIAVLRGVATVCAA